MSSKKNLALFLLAMLKERGGTARLGAGVVEAGPPELAKKLAPKIREHKGNLVRLLLQLDCAECGFEMKFDGQARFDNKTWLQGLKCPNGHQAFYKMPGRRAAKCRACYGDYER